MKKNFKGFTYYELLIAVSIMLLMAGFVAISLGMVHRNDVNRTADRVESAIKAARNNAISKGTDNGYVNFYCNNGELYCYVGEGMTNTFSFYTDSREWEKVSANIDDFYVSWNDGADHYTMNFMSTGLFCLDFKQSTGELIGLKMPYSGDYFIACDDFTISFEQGTNEASVYVEKYGNITVQN